MGYDLELERQLNSFVPTPYQRDAMNALERDGKKRLLLIWPRRAGKDYICWWLCIRQCLRKVCTVFYMLPTQNQARKVIWSAIDRDGKRFLDMIPKDFILKINEADMKITFVNGSVLQLCGSDNHSRIVGTGAHTIVLSEYALADPRAYAFLKPMIVFNDGNILVCSTPRGRNHLWQMYNVAINSDEWYVSKLTVDDTQHISRHAIEKEKAEGLISEHMIQQEYYTSFNMGHDQSIYGKYLNQAVLDGRITRVSYENEFPVHCAFDIGRDTTAIIFFQIQGKIIAIIDYYQKMNESLDHFMRVLEDKGYRYGTLFFPHDMRVTEWGGEKRTRLAKVEMYGYKCKIANLDINNRIIPLEDGIEQVRSNFHKLWIDEEKCAELIKCLENYRRDFDEDKEVYSLKPVHDKYSHGCFTPETLLLTRSGTRPIVSLKKGEEIMTQKGWKPCNGATLMRKNAPLVQVCFTDGTVVNCTPDHLYLTESGWRCAQYLEKGTKIQSVLAQPSNTGMGAHIDCGAMNDISEPEATRDCIEMFGNIVMGIYQKIATFITKIGTGITTKLPILSACQSLNIYDLSALTLRAKGCPKKHLKPQLFGIDPQKGENGIEITQTKLEVGKNGAELPRCVPSAQKSISALCERIRKNIVQQTVRHVQVESVKHLQQVSDVYCINVPDIHHFALSNGAIVHNSDALRYLMLAVPKITTRETTPEELEARYRSARFGHQHNLPEPLRPKTGYSHGRSPYIPPEMR